MTLPAETPASFAYQAQTPDGQRLSGTVDAPDAAEATRRLAELGLRVSEMAPAARPPRPKALRATEFAAFNQQLAHLAKAGLPLEHGLRLIAADLGSGRLSRTVEQVAAELEGGTPLGEAFEKHRGRFPALYGRLVAAGVRAGNLPGVLFNLGRHLELVQRLREAVWRAFAYPLMVLAGLIVVLVFVGLYVLPKFEQIFAEFQMKLPPATQVLLGLSAAAPALAALLVLALFGGPALWAVLRWRGWEGAALDAVARWAPLVGPVVRRNLVARWCDALGLGVAAGMDLPAAIEVAGDATGSPALRRDGAALVDRLAAGQPLGAGGGGRPAGEILPPSVPATLHFAAGHHDLPTTIEALGEMYQRQAELRLAVIPAVLTPLLVVLIAVLIAFVVMGLVAPLFAMIRGMTG
jgi:type II secretory pathway component PulF